MGSARAYLITLASVVSRFTRVRPVLVGAAAAVAFLVVVQILWGPPAGIVVQGALLGGLSALLALGLALVYRAHRILNFAQGDLGAAPASLAVLLVVTSGTSWLVAFVAGLASAVVLGVLVEALVIRRFFRSPRLVLSVATIGLAQVLAGLGLLLPGWFGVDLPPQSFSAPIDVSFTVEPLRFGGNDVVALIVIPLAFVGLALFLRTRIGLAMRACADDIDRAALVGIPVRRVHSIVWAIASILAFLAVFLRAGIVGLSLGTVLGPSLLLPALAAAVIGRMERLPTIGGAAIALGILEQSVLWGWNEPSDVYPVLFVVVVAAVWLTPAGSGLRTRLEPSTWKAVREPRPVPRELARLPEVRATRALLVATVALALVLVPVVFTESRTNLAAVAVVYGIIALSLVVLTGWAGEISLGQMAFVAVGAAVGASLTARLGLDLALGLLGAGAMGAAIAVLIGLPVLRRRGLTLAVITLAFGLATTAWLLSPRVFGEGTRFDWLPPPRVERPDLFGVIDVRSESRYYLLCLAALALVIVGVVGIRRSRTGRALVAIRENERAASAFGINPRTTTLQAFAVSGFLAAFAGALFVHQQNGLQVDSYSAGESLVVFTMVVIGGLGSVPGALLGALFVRGVTWWLPVEWQILATGAGMLVVLLVFRGGLGAALADARDALLRRVARRRGIVVPALTGTVTPPTVGTPVASSAGPTDAWLQVRGLAAEHDGVLVLDGIDLDARGGEIVALLGTNGSGKSTLLDAIAGVHAPSRGRVTIDGVDTTRARAERLAGRGVAEAPADHGVFPTLTVRENLRLAGWRVRERAATRAALADALELFPRLEERAAQRAGDLSGGEQHMLTLAMAFAAAPRLLLVDELSLGLSPEATRRVQERLRALRDDGVAIVVVEQSIDRAIALADHAVFLDGGTVRYSGTPPGLLERPDLVRATFLGAAAAVTSTRVHTPRAAVSRPDARPALELRDVSVRFGGVDALDGVSLSVARGEIVGVIGPNGAGKTTLFDTVSGFTRLDTGTIELRTDLAAGADTPARDITRLAPHTRAALGLGRSFQDGRLFPALTVRETIAVACERAVRVRNPIAAALHLPAVGRSEAAVGAKVDELVERLQLGPFADRFGHELSTGTRRIVDLACVLAHEPAVLLLDEPAAGVAQREAEALGPLLAEVRDSLDAAVLVVEHDLGVLGAVADRIVALDRGRVVASGSPEVVLADPAVTGA
jgi:ABC-type branched-subunit amino acid transport system ATPase component/ABC-type branched-subunit amino acid transport system permease subunit